MVCHEQVMMGYHSNNITCPSNSTFMWKTPLFCMWLNVQFNLGKVKVKTMLVNGRVSGATFELSAAGASWFALHYCNFAYLLACEKGHIACFIFKPFSLSDLPLVSIPLTGFSVIVPLVVAARRVAMDTPFLVPDCNLVPRVLWLFGQRMGASRDSGVLEFCYRKISAVKQWKSLQGSQSKNLNFFEFPRVSTGAHPLTKKPEDSGYEIGLIAARLHQGTSSQAHLLLMSLP